jgi:serine/threonine-protein kinase Stk1
MCEVFSALDLCRLEWSDTAPQVAVKRLLPELAGNRQAQLALAREFFTLRHLVHPGVVRAYDLHREPGGICYSMELLEGLSLHQTEVAAPSGLGKDGLRIAARLFETLAYLHGKGVVHADVKPANLFTAPEGRLVLIDFNISQVTAKPGAACSPIAQGLRADLKFPAHSLLHSSPERLQSGCPSMADDVFAACCTVYELIEGRHPFKRLSSLEAAEKKMQPQKPGSLPGLQWKLLQQGLSFSATARPGADQLRRAFGAQSILSRLRFSLAG